MKGPGYIANSVKHQEDPKPDNSPVGAELWQLMNTIDRLFVAVKGLEEQANPYLIPDSPACETAKGHVLGGPSSPHGQAIQSANERLCALENDIMELTNRIER